MKYSFPRFNSLLDTHTLLIALLGVPLCFLVFVALYYFSSAAHLEEVEERIDFLYQKEIRFQLQKKREEVFLSNLEKADRFYLDKQIESQNFLQSEIEQLEAKAQINNEEARRRLQFLKEGTNRLAFAEENLRRFEAWQEVEERQIHAVEMDEEDLKRTLSLIEGSGNFPLHAPQLIIKQFDLTKKNISTQEEVYAVSMQLIKRELLKKK